MHARVTFASLLVLAACARPAPSTKPTTPAAPAGSTAAGEAVPKRAFVQIEADEEKITPRGASVPAPKGWFVESRPDGLAFEDPERELRVTIVELDAPSSDAAVATALSRLGRTAPAKVKRQIREPDVSGWDEVYELVWETGPEAPLMAINVRRSGSRTWAALIEGPMRAFGRRGAEMARIVGGLHVSGIEEEDLARSPVLPLAGARAKEFEDFVVEAMKSAHVPGAAVAVVKDGAIVFEKGFGVREQGKPARVDVRTRFMIGSITKSLTTLLVATLVDAGKMTWDTPVKKLEPTFSAGDAAFTGKLTVADTFCACTGMPRRDLEMVFEYAKTKPERMFTWFDGQTPTTTFGETFQYNNQMTALGGFLTARVAAPKLPLDKAYATALKSRVLGPMGMTDSTASFDEGKVDAAVPHASSLALGFGEKATLPFDVERFVSPVAPAGAVFATVHDMARYAIVELGGGKTAAGARVVSEENMLARRKSRVRVGSRAAYGAGLMTAKSKGVVFVTHDGGTFGFTSRFILFPEKNVGLVVLTNVGGLAHVADAVTSRLQELTMGAKPHAADVLARAIARDEAEFRDAKAEMGKSVPDAVARDLLGTWSEARLGTLVFTKDSKGGLTVDAGEWKSRVGYGLQGKFEQIYFLDPPLAGASLRREEGTLVIPYNQDVFRFTKK